MVMICVKEGKQIFDVCAVTFWMFLIMSSSLVHLFLGECEMTRNSQFQFLLLFIAFWTAFLSHFPVNNYSFFENPVLRFPITFIFLSVLFSVCLDVPIHLVFNFYALYYRPLFSQETLRIVRMSGCPPFQLPLFQTLWNRFKSFFLIFLSEFLSISPKIFPIFQKEMSVQEMDTIKYILYEICIPSICIICFFAAMLNILVFISRGYCKSRSASLELTYSLALSDTWTSIVIGVSLFWNSYKPVVLQMPHETYCFPLTLEVNSG